jgi:aromatic-L-amino-acid decarboxylase
MPLCKGIRYFETARGSGGLPPVVLIHGAGCDHLVWPPALRRLDGMRVIAPDLPGHGNSERKPCASIRRYAERLLQFLDDRGIFHAAVAGHSMGALIALEMAKLAPDQVTCLAVIGAGLEPLSSPRIAHLIDQPLEPNLIRQILMETFFSSPTPPGVKEVMLKNLDTLQSGKILRDWRLCLGYEPGFEGVSPGMPVCVISGEDDRIVSPASARALAGRFHHSFFHPVKNAGHMLIQEQPQAIATILAAFLKYCFSPIQSPEAVHPLSKNKYQLSPPS